MDNQPGAARSVAWISAILATAAIFLLHIRFMNHAGALWRDEVSMIDLAGAPSLGELWRSLEYDSFPVLSLLLTRLWSGTGWGASDSGLRGFGLLVGVAILGALWLNARRPRRSPPVISLLLFGLSPLAIRVGDAVRPYGLGIFFILLTFGLVWRFVEKPTPVRFAAASLAAVLSAQSLYQNAFLILAVCLGGMTVTLRNGMWKRSAAVAGIGLAAALSLVPYLGIIKKAQDWAILNQSPVDLELIWGVLSEALSAPAPFMLWVWGGLFIVGFFIPVFYFFKPPSGASEQEADMALFGATTMVTGAVGFIFFLEWAGVPPQPWYFLPMMGVAAVSVDAILSGKMERSVWGPAFSLLMIPFLLFPVWQKVPMRQTNIDLVAFKLQESAKKEDMIVLSDWYYGVSFQRYYKGEASWGAIPPIEDLTIHRYDLLKKQMASPDPIQPVLSKIAETLTAGNRVWLVGLFPAVQMGETPIPLPPAPHPEYGWNNGPYLWSWKRQAVHFIQSRADEAELFSAPLETPTNQFENLPVVVVKGWKP
ncbi:MAG TPA: hypothetical protein VI382_08730 [Candidatus Manganitrophaceae bacterium]|nr:hypothetical protein [Candidatus Manganitrophaceae bacterium]